MKKLIPLSFILMFSSSLFAFTAGEKYIYGGIGAGTSTGFYDPVSGVEAGVNAGGNPNLFNDLENKSCLTWNIGAGGEYLFTDSLAVLAGIFYEVAPIRGIYPKKTAAADLEITTEFKYLTIPLGVHYYFLKYFLAGGGLYYSKVLSDDTTVEYGPSKETYKLKSRDDVGAFADLGTSFAVTDSGNLLIFARCKTGRVVSDTSDMDEYRKNIKIFSVTLNAAYGLKF